MAMVDVLRRPADAGLGHVLVDREPTVNAGIVLEPHAAGAEELQFFTPVREQ